MQIYGESFCLFTKDEKRIEEYFAARIVDGCK